MRYEDIKLEQSVWSSSMGEGKVMGISVANQPKKLVVHHGNQVWQYNEHLIRDGNNLPDLYDSKYQVFVGEDITDPAQRALIDTITDLVTSYDNSI